MSSSVVGDVVGRMVALCPAFDFLVAGAVLFLEFSMTIVLITH